jgi:DNA end-binding protein Ku
MARPSWKGTLSFGLVNIGVELYTMETSESLNLDMLDKRDMGRIGYQKYNKTTGELVTSKDIVKGYAVAKNKYVVLSDEDLKSANPKATRTIDVIGFVPTDDIGRIYYARPHLVGPSQGSGKAYRLLYDVLEKTEQVALARIVMHTKEHTAALYPHDDALVLQLLRYDRDLRSAKDLDIELPDAGAVRAAEYDMAAKLVETMAMEWDPSQFEDTFRDDLMKMITARARKGTKETLEPPRAEKDETPVLDLMAALKRSLNEEKNEKNGKDRTRAGTRAKSRTTATSRDGTRTKRLTRSKRARTA